MIGKRPIGKSAIWVAAHLGSLSSGAAVRRGDLREMALERRREPGSDVKRPGIHRGQLRVMRGEAGHGSLGTKSAAQLSRSLKELEHLGLIVRDPDADAVVVLNPAGLRKLVELRKLEKGTWES